MSAVASTARTITYREALREGLRSVLLSNPDVAGARDGPGVRAGS